MDALASPRHRGRLGLPGAVVRLSGEYRPDEESQPCNGKRTALVPAGAFSAACLRRSVMWQTGGAGLAGAAYCEVHIGCAASGVNAPGGEARVPGWRGSLWRAEPVPVRLAALRAPGSPGVPVRLAGVAAAVCLDPARG